MAPRDAAKHMMQNSLDELKGYKIRSSVANLHSVPDFRYFQRWVMAHHDTEFIGRREKLQKLELQWQIHTRWQMSGTLWLPFAKTITDQIKPVMLTSERFHLN